MKNFSSILITIFAFMFWTFRLITTILYTIGVDFMAMPIDITMEVPLLFITFICICYIIKRKLLPTIIYLISHFLYYGLYLYQSLTVNTLTLNNYMDLFFAIIGISIPLATFFDILLDKNRKSHPVDKQTDWFYKNKNYDRKMDDRADRNQYRTLDK